MEREVKTIDGNEAAASVAHRVNEVIAIYPITPSSPMGEFSDAWSSDGRKNIWGTVPSVYEMQSEGGAAGAVHGALQSGALTTTFTSSQGLLLMIPNMFKIAGELTPTVFHVAARALAAHALSIFGDHADVMAARPAGWAMLCASSVQETHDFAAIATAATLEARVPFIHFFDGFRTSHEVMKINCLGDDDLRALIDEKAVAAHRARGLSPENPVIRGTAQNPDVYFQGREAGNPYYDATPETVQRVMDRFAAVVGRRYKLFDYVGAADAERVLVVMGSGAETAEETVEDLSAKGEKVGVVKVRLFRPFSAAGLIAALPKSVKKIAVLDRCKEPGGAGEPLYLDVVGVLAQAAMRGGLPFALPNVVGGRYGLSSKEFTPAMVKAVLDELKKDRPKNNFTVGIVDDVTHLSLDADPSYTLPAQGVFQALFFGLGSDGTVGANKNTIKIIGEETENFAQGYFVYDSKKSGSITVSHLRFGMKPIRSAYLLDKAQFVGCHHWSFLERYDVLEKAVPGGVFLLNSPYPAEEVWDRLPRLHQERIIAKKLKVFVIDAFEVAKNAGMGGRVNTIMQTCFFAISGVLPKDEAIEQIKKSIKKTYGAKGDAIVAQNFRAVDVTLEHLHELKVPDRATSTIEQPPVVPDDAPEFVKKVTAAIIKGEGDALPVSALPADGTFPADTARYEKRNIALEIPVWDPETCIQCNKCSLVCPHAAIRAKVYPPEALAAAPATFKSVNYKAKDFPGAKFTIQVAPEDCTGCGLCVHFCPAKNKQEPKLRAINMAPQLPLRATEKPCFEFFLGLPDPDRTAVRIDTVKGSQFLQPLFEFSGACAGCGETPYVKLLSQLFGDRAMVANATGCSSIYGGNLPTTPWARNKEGRGPAWANSLFEDNAEFGLGFRLTVDQLEKQAKELVRALAPRLPETLVSGLLDAPQKTEAELRAQRERVAELRRLLAGMKEPEAARLAGVSDALCRRSVWIVGGDGWAYDIGYGGLDHVLASGRDVNVLVLDTEVYSNTGGQMSKSTPMGAVAKFAAAGRPRPKKDLGLMAMAYGDVYVAQVAMGADDPQTVKAFVEAEAHPGPSLIIAYSHCIAHGINMRTGTDNQKAAVASGHWLLYRFDPARAAKGEAPLSIDSRPASIPLADYTGMEARYKMLMKAQPERAKELLAEAQRNVAAKRAFYEQLAAKAAGPSI